MGNQDFARSALQLACTLGRQLNEMRKALVAGTTIFEADFARLYLYVTFNLYRTFSAILQVCKITAATLAVSLRVGP